MSTAVGVPGLMSRCDVKGVLGQLSDVREGAGPHCGPGNSRVEAALMLPAG